MKPRLPARLYAWLAVVLWAAAVAAAGGGSRNATIVPAAAAADSAAADGLPGPRPQGHLNATAPAGAADSDPDRDRDRDRDRYVPGLLTVAKLGVRLSQGLDLRVVATSGRTVEYAGGGGGGGRSSEPFHQRPDYGATFPAPGTSGGWAYVSNSEIPDGGGGVGVLTFDGGGEVTGYGRLLRGTDRNCGGGATGWGTFLSCEEAGGGHCHQLGPFGGEVHRNASRTSLGGSRGGHFESVASDERGRELGHPPTFYVTEDATRGALRRFRPSVADWEDPATMLHGDGTFEYLVLQPTDGRGRFGRARWTDDEDEARDSAWRYYQYSEGIEIVGGTMYFTSRRGRDLFIVDIDAGTYEREHLPSTDLAFSPDQIVRLGGDGDMLYLTNHGWVRGAAGVYGRESRTGRYVPILESTVYDRLTTGLAFSPDGRHMYICFQKAGILFDVWRRDGRKFGGKPMNLKYRA